MTWDEQQRGLASSLTDEEFRKAGFSGHARHHPRSERGFLWLCAWNGIKPDLAPPTWRFASNEWMLDYCERQAAAD